MSRRGPEIALVLAPHGSIGSLVQLAQEAETLGYRQLWVTDDRLQKDVFAVLAAIALATSTVGLGPGVTNPYSRHPALIASAIATIDELSGGRALLGLGAGGTNHRALGVKRTAPVAALSEAIELIRGLLAGGEVSLEGKVVKAGNARLDFAPPRPAIPIYLGARGPRMLELAGAVADGVIVGNVASVDGWRYALGQIEAGARRAGRNLETIRLIAWIYCAVDDDSRAALEAIRPMVATSLATSRPILSQLGLELPAEYERRMSALDWSLERDAVAEAGAAIPDETLRWFGLAGSPQECAASLREIVAAFPRISQVAIVPAASEHSSPAEVMRRFSREVAPLALAGRVAV